MWTDTWPSSKPELQTYDSFTPSGTTDGFIRQSFSTLPHSYPAKTLCMMKNKHTSTFRDKLSVPCSSVKQSPWSAWPLSKGPIFCAETLVYNHHSKMRKIPFECRSFRLFYFQCTKYDKCRICDDEVTDCNSGSFPTTLQGIIDAVYLRFLHWCQQQTCQRRLILDEFKLC